ncbi:hypothetical protein LX99_03787 [Mucilaginibacter oryzae]|uniref:Uncharacterized protein n=1 Tax=Mucilaginibacter oryzae TaxID=468058 RepID=A0A316H343_9SPHI|nr:hypothetical protein [Mucilaginibacter oryzae]PWK75294.1 hypothetical protein LX99_03787 [Mucilaginibacter oryzae]
MAGVTPLIVTAFEKYKNVIFNVNVDLNFWTSFIDKNIDSYQYTNGIPNDIYDAIFGVYDWDVSSGTGYLKSNILGRTILKSDLKRERQDFFSWVRNLAVLKSYNALELFLHQAIWIAYFPSEKNPIISKKAADNLQNKIKEFLVLAGLPTDTKNNRHIMVLLRCKALGYSIFLDSPMNVDLITTWANFFEMFSVLRNVIAHQGTVINNDTLNEIQSKSKDIFKRHFDVVSDQFKEKNLKPKEADFDNFINIVNTFALNSVKIALGECDFKFLNMY